jgi:hypothetical protein
MVLACLYGASISDAKAAHLRNLHGLMLDITNENKCGITDKLIHDAFMYPASSAQFQIFSTPPNGKVQAVLSIDVRTLVPTEGFFCVSNIKLTVSHFQSIKYFTEESEQGLIFVWQNDWLGYSVPSAHPSQVKAAVEDLAKSFITDWPAPGLVDSILS